MGAAPLAMMVLAEAASCPLRSFPRARTEATRDVEQSPPSPAVHEPYYAVGAPIDRTGRHASSLEWLKGKTGAR